jgi:asparagine synthase (glutamine-hydrolysing)
MCGIAGAAGPGTTADLVLRMTRTLRHRGPDDEGIHLSPRHAAALGNRRLSIIDLEGGHQPISSEDGSLWIVFNGEIYNHAELRVGLERTHKFRTRSDTEVLLHLFEERGPAALDALIGMFALAILDERDGSIFLARDRLGKKPLIYCQLGERLLFASEIKAILADASVPRQVDADSLDLYLAHLYVPSPRTMFRGIAKLPPGHWARWHGGKFEAHRYWTPRPAATPRLEIDDRVRGLLDESVRLRLVSDVPVASFLSGGIDSTIVTALAASHVPRLKTVSVGFEERSHNELPYAREVARRYATDHVEIVVRPDALALVETLSNVLDEPFGDSSALPTYVLCREAARHGKVALAGDGGDECFGGYLRYAAMARLGLVRRAPASLTALAARVLPWGRAPTRTLSRIRALLLRPDAAPAEAYRWLVTFLSDEERARLMRNGKDGPARRYIPGAHADWSDPVNSAALADLLTYLPEDLLVKVDQASMASSLEVRSPFLDHRLVELSLGIPGRLKIRGTQTKYYLRNLYRDLIPESGRRRRKQGFAIPLKKWLEEDLRPLVDDALLSRHPRLEFCLDPGAVSGLVEAHRRGRADHAEVLWALVMFELWLKRFNPSAPST